MLINYSSGTLAMVNFIGIPCNNVGPCSSLVYKYLNMTPLVSPLSSIPPPISEAIIHMLASYHLASFFCRERAAFYPRPIIIQRFLYVCVHVFSCLFLLLNMGLSPLLSELRRRSLYRHSPAVN